MLSKNKNSGLGSLLKFELVAMIEALEAEIYEASNTIKDQVLSFKVKTKDLQDAKEEIEATLAFYTDLIPECKTQEMMQELEDFLLLFKLKWARKGF